VFAGLGDETVKKITGTASVADPDPGSGAFYPLDPKSGMNVFCTPDPRFRIPDLFDYD
jgi:hypothetical protein